MKTPYHWIKRDQIRSLLKLLDKEITGKNETHKNHQDFPEEFEFGDVHYQLSDGRSSVSFGLNLGKFNGRLFISTNSSADAKKKFEELRVLRAVIETFSLCGGEKND